MSRWETERADWAQRQAGLELRIVQLQEQLLATLTRQIQQPAPQPALQAAPVTSSSPAQSAVMSSSTAQSAAMPPASAANAEASAAMSAAAVSLEAAIAAEAGPGAALSMSFGDNWGSNAQADGLFSVGSRESVSVPCTASLSGVPDRSPSIASLTPGWGRSVLAIIRDKLALLPLS